MAVMPFRVAAIPLAAGHIRAEVRPTQAVAAPIMGAEVAHTTGAVATTADAGGAATMAADLASVSALAIMARPIMVTGRAIM